MSASLSVLRTVLALALFSWGAQAQGFKVDAPRLQPRSASVVPHQALAASVVRQWAKPAFRNLVQSRFSQRTQALPLVSLARDYRDLWPGEDAFRFHAEMRSTDQGVRRAKGLERHAQELLELRLIRPRGTAPLAWDQVLVAYAPTGDDRTWTHIPAFDAAGQPLRLDIHQQPDVPVLVVGINSREDLRAGIAMVNEGLAKAGLQRALPSREILETSKLDYIRLKNDQEPWIKGGAEIYALVSGVDIDETKANIKLVDLPYLDNDGQDYYPNQVLIFWGNYRFNAANIQFFEHDDNTDYQALLGALLGAVGTILKFTGQAEFAWIPDVANAILQAMPKEWWKDTDDYVDCFYTIMKNQRYDRHVGVSGNTTLTLTPFTLTAQ